MLDDDEYEEYTIKITDTCEKDIDEIIMYIAVDNKQIALTKLNAIKTRISLLSNFPKIGRIVSELFEHNITEYRELIEYPWRIIYKIEKPIIHVVTVIDGRRNVGDILIKKLLTW